MFWSFSSSNAFRKCQRQWYFKNCVASARAKDPTRREAYLLSKLQSIYAWRGALVDRIISDHLIPALNRSQPIVLAELLRRARYLFDRQLEFARGNRLREPGLAPSKVGDSFAALFAVDYGQLLSAEDIDSAWKDVDTALHNLFEMQELRSSLKSGVYRIAQRALTFPHSGVTVRAVPDLIVFFPDRAPAIIDWKVHSFGTSDYRLQLALYSLALSRVAAHRDFPTPWQSPEPTTIELLEAQLLSASLRKYELTDEDIEAAEDYIASSASRMLLLMDEHESGPIEFDDLLTTQNPEFCQRCSFRKLCWETST